MTLFHDNFLMNFFWQFLMTIFWWQYLMTYRQFLTIGKTVLETWHLRHWLQLWQLWTCIHDNLCYLTIKSDTGQHSQFLRCFTRDALMARFSNVVWNGSTTQWDTKYFFKGKLKNFIFLEQVNSCNVYNLSREHNIQLPIVWMWPWRTAARKLDWKCKRELFSAPS